MGTYSKPQFLERVRSDEGLSDGNGFIFFSSTMLVYWRCFFFLWAGACMIEDGRRRNKGFIYVLLLERLIRVHGVNSDV